MGHLSEPKAPDAKADEVEAEFAVGNSAEAHIALAEAAGSALAKITAAEGKVGETGTLFAQVGHEHVKQLFFSCIDRDCCLLVHGSWSWLEAHGSWLMSQGSLMLQGSWLKAHGQGGPTRSTTFLQTATAICYIHFSLAAWHIRHNFLWPGILTEFPSLSRRLEPLPQKTR